MGYSTFTTIGVKEVLLGMWDLLYDGYLLVPSSLFYSLLIFTIPLAAGNMGLQALNAVGLAIVGDYLIGLTFPMVAAPVFQAYLSRAMQQDNWEGVRSTFQRTALIWLTIFLLIQVPILCNWDLILMLVGQDHQLAHIAQIYIFIQFPRYFAMYTAYLCLMMLYAQDSVWPTLLANFLNLVLVVICEILVLIFHSHVYVLAVGVCVSQLVTTAVVIGIFFIKQAQCDHLDLVKFEANSFFDWSEMFCQTILSIMQHIATRCIVEIGVIFGGILSPVELGAATILRRYTAFATSIPLNLMAPVVCKSIGASLGKRSHISVKVYIISGLLFAFVIGLFLTVFSVLLRQPIAGLMTNDTSVKAITADLTLIVAILDWIMMVYMTNIFVFRGLGSMAFPTIVGLLFQYGLSLPLSIILVFIAHMHLTGYFLALCIAFSFELLVESGYLHLFKLPALVMELESNEQEPLIESEKVTSDATPQVESESSEPSSKLNWINRCCLLILAVIFINCIAIGIHFLSNYLLG